MNTKDNLGKFDAKAYEAIFVGYSSTSKAYRVFNKSSHTIEESMHVKFEESNTIVENVVEIDSLGEDMEKISLTHPFKMTSKNLLVKFKRMKWNNHNHFLKIGDTPQIIPKISS